VRIDLFRMERTQCLYENEVEYNLSESGVRPLRLEELLEGEDRAGFLVPRLEISGVDGSPELCERIAQFHGVAAHR